MKTLRAIQILAKIARILALIIFICCCVGVGGCVLALIILPILEPSIKDVVIQDGKTVNEVLAQSGITFTFIYTAIGVGLTACIVTAIIAKFTELFFKEQIDKGTPFDMEIVKSMRKLAIIQICISIGYSIVLAIVLAVLAAFFPEIKQIKWSYAGAIWLGVFFLILSLFAEYGTEKDEKKEIMDNNQEEM